MKKAKSKKKLEKIEEDFITPPTPIMEMTSKERFSQWPNLTKKSFKKTSSISKKYNCVAWALGKEDIIYNSYSYYWPDKLPREHTVENYAMLYKEVGYTECTNGDYEEEIEKIAIYGDELGLFTHVSLQLKNGLWTSKMGILEDIVHNKVDDVSGILFGEVKIFMCRERNEESPN